MTNIEILRAKHLKSGDTKPNLRLKLLEDEDPFNLDGYTATVIIKLAGDDSLTVNSNATIESKSRGIVTYDWSENETNAQGTYKLEVVAKDGTEKITFPNNGTQKIYIEERLQ